ncbi:MFS transporter [Fundidesulfovibrio agrisoli]|uniref:MFS transporter n=1 Tax=Fundidesulfovibrio agrisoli TaxID=2922717 RepID=UPI001FAC78D1|nr:MFS transporter [Fundidesulfovibrio agrisoli]
MQTSVFSNPSFKRFWLSRVASGFAYQMMTVAVGWQMYELTGSALSLGLVGLAQFLPQLALTLVVGHAADHMERRRIVFACQAAQGVLAAALAAGSFAGLVDQHAIYACAFAIGAARSFEMPTMQALLPGLAETAMLPRMLALSASGWQSAVIVGPALGGALYAAGPQAVYGVCAVCFVLGSAAMFSIPRQAPQARREPPNLRSVLGGISFIRSRPEILGAISLDLFSVLLGGATALLPVYAKDILHTGPWGLGMLRAAPAVGALSMSLFLARVPLNRHVGHKMFGAVAVFGVSTVVFGLSTSFPLSLAALACLGASDMVSVVIRSTLVQLETPDDLRGRVSAVNSIFIGTSNQLGEFESGVTAALFGAVGSVVLGGIGTLVVVALWMRLFPALRLRDKLVVNKAG